VVRHEGGQVRTEVDVVTVEEPLEIRVVAEVGGRRTSRSVAVTMRTPGEDLELAAGFLVSEGVVRRREDIWRIEHCREGGDPADDNVLEVFLAPTVDFDLDQLSRNVLTSSACGICGRSSIESVRQICSDRPLGDFQLPPGAISPLVTSLEGAQGVFAHTGGIHAAALFSPMGELLELREDVGRHNALDKLVGTLLGRGELPAAERLVLVSGRASFELVQKSLLAGIPMLAAVGAPSSLAVDLAKEYGMTLIGFLRQDRFNIYCGGERIADH
jgi:FdhD protein